MPVKCILLASPANVKFWPCPFIFIRATKIGFKKFFKIYLQEPLWKITVSGLTCRIKQKQSNLIRREHLPRKKFIHPTHK